MSTISSIDNFTSTQIGEKGCREYKWSNNVKEKILQLNFQLTRSYNPSTIINLSILTDKILVELVSSYKANIIFRDEYLELMSLMFRTIGFTRDIIDGKGEYTLAFMLLDVWYNHFPELSKFALRHFVFSPENSPKIHPFGSWKDIKYLFSYFINYKTKFLTTGLIDYGLELIIEQLKLDIISFNPSLLAKWIPREKSKFGKLFTKLACKYFKEFIKDAKNEKSKQLAFKKCKMEFRKIISSLNKKLDTVQIKQCALNWSQIVPSKLTSITLVNQKCAFLKIIEENEDRIACAKNFKESLDNNDKLNGKFVSLNKFVSEAIKLIKRNNKESYEAIILNNQWIDNSNQTLNIENFICMVDLSNNYDINSRNESIALGIRIAQKSYFKKRLLTFSAKPTWINLEDCNTFVNMVDKVISNSNFDMNANFSDALKMIIDAIIIQQLTHYQVENLVIVLISDMQVDQLEKTIPLKNYIDEQFLDAGLKLWHKPFNSPHIIFWNIRSTSGFPSLSIYNNCSMISGNNPNILNNFSKSKKYKKNDKDVFNLVTPWNNFIKLMKNKRYDILDKKLRDTL
jgi:hypothetical protein